MTKSHRHYLRYRLAALMLLGFECARCGETDYRVLEIDHKVPVRRRHQGLEYARHSGAGLVRQVLALGPKAKKSFRLLCANCHKRDAYK